MFEHKNLDGNWNSIVPAKEAFLKGDILECRDSAGAESSSISRRQYAVIADTLVERCLPSETLGDCWSFDAVGVPWWGSVKNPPHMGIIAEFNSYNRGDYRKQLDTSHNVVAYASAGEEVIFSNGTYTVLRQSDNKEVQAGSLIELRGLYFSAS